MVKSLTNRKESVMCTDIIDMVIKEVVNDLCYDAMMYFVVFCSFIIFM